MKKEHASSLLQFYADEPLNSKQPSFSETEKLALFAFWSERDDPEEISRAVEQHPDWLRYAWLGMAKYTARKNDFRAAYELTQRYGEPVALPRVAPSFSLQDLEKRFAAAPNYYSIGYELYRAQMQNGQIDDALLTARHFSERPNSPAYFLFLEAQCGLRNKIGNVLGMPGWRFMLRRHH